MEKLVYLVFQAADLPGAELRSALIEKAAPALKAAGAERIVIDVHDEETAAGTPLRRSDPPIRAMVSFWLENYDDRAPCEEAIAVHARAVAGFLVTESRPLVHETNPGGRSPGMNQVTCIAKKPGLSDDEFFQIWHVDHKKVAIETQSTTGYIRNVITRRLTPDAPNWTAIVEEIFPIGALTDPKVFYPSKDDAELKVKQDRMMESCYRFLDFEPMEVTHMSEYVLD